MSILPGGAQLIRENVLSLHCGKVATTEEMLLATDKRKASSSHRTGWYWNAKRKQQSKPGNTTFSVIFFQWLVERFLSWFIARAHKGRGGGDSRCKDLNSTNVIIFCFCYRGWRVCPTSSMKAYHILHITSSKEAKIYKNTPFDLFLFTHFRWS